MRMFKVPAGTGFTLVPEGVHVFKVESIDYKQVYGKMEVNLVTKEGFKHTERYTMMDSNGRDNPGAIKAFGYFAHCCLNDFDATDIDLDDLIGRYIECTVTHEEVEGKNGKTMTFARLGDKAPASGFEGEDDSAAEEAPAPAPTDSKPNYDLDSLLG